MLVFLVSLNALLWTVTGLSLCWATHRQRGIDADRLDIVWPDTVPDWLADWVDSDRFDRDDPVVREPAIGPSR